MSGLQWFAVDESGPHPLSIPPTATMFEDLYSDFPVSVYSSLRTFAHNKFLRLGDHLDRTERSMALLNWDFTLDRELVCRALHQVCTASPDEDVRVRIEVFPEPVNCQGRQSRLFIALLTLTPYPEHFYTKGIALGIASEELVREQPLAKTGDFAQIRRLYKRDDVHDSLLVDKDGYLLEGMTCNFYGIRDGVVYTAGENILPGIAQKIILSLLPSLEIPFTLQAIHRDELTHLDEAGISSASRALMPATRVGGRVIGNGRVGPLSRRIFAAYQAYLNKEIKLAIEL